MKKSFKILLIIMGFVIIWMAIQDKRSESTPSKKVINTHQKNISKIVSNTTKNQSAKPIINIKHKDSTIDEEYKSKSGIPLRFNHIDLLKKEIKEYSACATDGAYKNCQVESKESCILPVQQENFDLHNNSKCIAFNFSCIDKLKEDLALELYDKYQTNPKQATKELDDYYVKEINECQSKLNDEILFENVRCSTIAYNCQNKMDELSPEQIDQLSYETICSTARFNCISN